MTFLAQCTAFAPLDFSFQVHQETCPFGKRSLAHLQTLREPVDLIELSKIPEVRIASASRSDTWNLVNSIARSRAYPSPNRNDPWGNVGSSSRLGAFALSALICVWRTPQFAMFANVLLCERTSLPNDPTALSIHHWAQPESGPQRKVSSARWVNKWRDCQTNWRWSIFHW